MDTSPRSALTLGRRSLLASAAGLVGLAGFGAILPGSSADRALAAPRRTPST